MSKGLTLNGITELSLLARNNVAVAAAYTPSLEAGIIPRVGCRQKIEQPNKFIDRRPDINTTSRALIRRSFQPAHHSENKSIRNMSRPSSLVALQRWAGSSVSNLITKFVTY